ncbi:MAG TPA: P1 family peptidase [Miltoncostaeaceae bacterium]|nr:P1 family peptidase [Miltoncostaeaceae bacterium]
MVSQIAGFRVGHWTDERAGTGCTVIIPPPGTVAGAEVRGGGPASRELELLYPTTSVSTITALCFAGGSAFGLETAGGVMRWCAERGMGHDTGAARVPVVPAACIYDLGFTGNARHPGADEGYAACMAAVEGPHECGSVGAGTGATLGKLRAADGWCKGGVGAAAVRTHDGVSFAALAVVNAWGDVIDADGSVIAGAVGEDGRFVSAAARVLTHPPDHPRLRAPANTTLVCIATDGRLTKTEAAQVARMAHAGMARAVSPVHTPFDGDLAVCLAAGRRPVSPFVAGVAAAEVAAGAIRDAAGRVRSLRGVPTGAERRASAGY